MRFKLEKRLGSGHLPHHYNVYLVNCETANKAAKPLIEQLVCCTCTLKKHFYYMYM